MRAVLTTLALTLVLSLLLAAAPAGPARAQARPPGIVAAENFYGDIAAQIAGPGIPVTSILSSPDQDPHLFAASPSTARAIAGAAIVVANGVDYDPWMDRLLRAGRVPKRQVIVAADLLRRKAGSNPHLWYDPATAPAMGRAIAKALIAADPAREAEYAGRLQAFEASLKPVQDKVAAMRARFAGQAVTATEPVFGPMAAALGLAMRNERFQLATMNGTEPRPSDVAAFEADLRGRKVRALIYNSQATGPAAQRLLQIARQAGIPVVPVTETQPAGATFQSWMLDQLTVLETSLAATP